MINAINQILIIVYVLSCLNMLRHGFLFVRQFKELDNDETMRYRLSKTELIMLGLSISYIITGIINGVII